MNQRKNVGLAGRHSLLVQRGKKRKEILLNTLSPLASTQPGRILESITTIEGGLMGLVNKDVIKKRAERSLRQSEMSMGDPDWVLAPSLVRYTILDELLNFAKHKFLHHSVQFSSVAQSCPTLCDPMNCSTPGLPVHHQLLEFTQTHVQ